MKSLLYKEFRLSVVPWAYIMSLLGALLLIPNWVYFVALMYVFITIPTMFEVCKDQRDIGFSVLLPVRKKDIVKARFISVIAIEMLQIIIAVIFALISNALYPYGNAWLMDLNAAFFGFAFVMYAIFNLIFITLFYKTGFKIAVPISISLAATLIFVILVEYFIQTVPILKAGLDTLSKDMLLPQLLVLVAGIFIFVLSAFISYKISAKAFEKIDV